MRSARRAWAPAILSLLLASACGSADSTTSTTRVEATPTTQTALPVLRGHIQFGDGFLPVSESVDDLYGLTLREGQPCGLFLRKGDRVVVEDGFGSVIGASKSSDIGFFRLNDEFADAGPDAFTITATALPAQVDFIESRSDCAFSFEVLLTGRADVYTVKVETLELELVMSHADLEAVSWTVTLAAGQRLNPDGIAT